MRSGRISLVAVTAQAHGSSNCTWRRQSRDVCAALCEVLNQGIAAEMQYNSQYGRVTHLFILPRSDWWHESERMGDYTPKRLD